ncbi:MAG: hypothetical protein KAS88_05045 [Deltaproteobacteria bacterium]|nr:hypothetical protein [Deltaproteobacteria bacterium]
MKHLEKLSNSDLLENYSNILTLLKQRGVIRTKNLVGDLGEYYAIEKYNNTPGLPNLQAAQAGTQNIDATSRQGERYSIKSTTTKLTGVFHGLNPPESKKTETQKFEHLIIVLLNDTYGLNSIIELTWSQFLDYKRWHKTMSAWNISITKNLLSNAKTIYKTNPNT